MTEKEQVRTSSNLTRYDTIMNYEFEIIRFIHVRQLADRGLLD